MKTERIPWEDEIRALVRPLTAKVHADTIALLGRELNRRLQLPAGIREKAPWEIARALHSHLLNLLQIWAGEDAVQGRRIQEWRNRYYRTPNSEERRQILRTLLESTSARKGGRLKRDLQAVDRHLDWEALEERLTIARNSIWIRMRIGMEVMQAMHMPVGGRTAVFKPDAETAISTIEALVIHLTRDSHPKVQQAAARASYSVMHNAPQIREEMIARYAGRLIRLVKNKEKSRWVRLAVIDLLGLFPVPSVSQELKEILKQPDGVQEDWFLFRAHAATALVKIIAHLHVGWHELLALANQPNSGEYTRLALVRGWREVDPKYQLYWLVRLLRVDALRSDPSPLVRARIAQAISVGLLNETAPPEARRQATESLAAMIEKDTNPVTRRAAQRVSATCVRHLIGDAVREYRRNLVRSLAARFQLGDREQNPSEQEQIAGLLEETRVWTHPELAARFKRIHALTVKLKVGESVRIRSGALPENELGRLMALLSRMDFGLYGQVRKKGVLLKRGEQTGRRVWRFLHEIVRKSPHKRQDVPHTTGRIYGGSLRAHPEGLAEVTPTTVPGERTFVESEGGWARYLPLVDDFLESSYPIKLFSSFGITTIRPSSNFLVRLKALWRLTVGYARWNRLRYQVLREPEPHRKNIYLLRVSELLGIKVTFTPWSYSLFGVKVDLKSAHVQSFFPEEENHG